MNYYNYNIELPFSKKVINFKEITTKQQIILAKANLSFPESTSNYFDYNNFIVKIISECIENPQDLNQINLVDYILFLTKIRIISIGSTINLITETKGEIKSAKTTLNLNHFLKSLYEAGVNSLIDDTIVENNVEVKICFPFLNSIKVFQDIINQKTNNYEAFIESYQEFIEYIKIRDKKILFFNFKTEEKKNILDKLSISIIKKIQDKIIEVLKVLTTSELWGVSNFKEHTFNFYNLSFVDFIRLFFSNDIKNVYKEICFMSNRGLTPEYILNLSPMERMIHISIVKEQIGAENKQPEADYDPYSISKGSKDLQDLALEFGDTPP